MASGAHIRGAKAEKTGPGIFDVMNAVTVDTGGDVRIAFA
jgi:hypothetical protein